MWTLKSELHMLIEHLLFNLINAGVEKQSNYDHRTLCCPLPDYQGYDMSTY